MRRRGRCVAISRSTWGRTWSTAPTGLKAPSGRSGSSSSPKIWSARQDLVGWTSFDLTRVDLRPPFPPEFRLLLASQSPRRHSLLRDIGVPYEVVTTSAEESLESELAADLA